jgi:hypothetical protein
MTFSARSFAAHAAVYLSFALLVGACSDGGDSEGAGEGGGNAAGTGGNAGNDGAGNGGNAGDGDADASAGDGGSNSGGSSGNGGAGSGGDGDSDGAVIDADGATDAEGPDPVLLGSAGNYVIVAKTAVSNVPTSVVNGDVALSPAAASYITGFELTRAGTHWTAPEVIGELFAADNDPPTPSELTTAISDMETAYTDAAGRPTPDFSNVGSGAIGGLTLEPGLYKFTSSVTVPADFEIAGGPNDVWIFQITGDFEMSADTRMTLSGGAQAKNIFWQIAGTADLLTGAHAEGIILCETAITLGSGASINGRLLAQTAVHIAGSTVTAP